jgi:hypothetical protein
VNSSSDLLARGVLSRGKQTHKSKSCGAFTGYFLMSTSNKHCLDFDAVLFIITMVVMSLICLARMVELTQMPSGQLSSPKQSTPGSPLPSSTQHRFHRKITSVASASANLKNELSISATTTITHPNDKRVANRSKDSHCFKSRLDLGRS